MAELDLQQQMVEAAKERSDIAKALLAIQSSLDKMEPMVSRMEHVLASVAPAINAGVHKAVEQPTEIAHDTAPASTPTAISAASTPIVASVPAATASASSATNSLILPATGGCFPRAHTTCSTTGLDPDTGHIHFAEVPLLMMDKFLTSPAHGELSYFGLLPSVGILSAVRPLEEAVHTPFRPPDLWNSRGRPPGPAPVPKPPWLLLGTTHMFEEIPATIVMAKRQSQDIATGEFIQPIFSHGNAWELQHVSWSSFLLYQTEAQQTGVLYCRRHEQVKHGREHCSFQVLRSPWPPPRQEGLQNPLTESACSLKGIPIAVLIVTCSSEVMAKYHITCSHVGVLWGYLCHELQSKEILVKRAYWHLIAEVRLEALKFSWLPPQVVLYCSGASASLYGSGYFTCGVALPIQAPILYPSGLVELQIAWLLVVQHSDGGKMFQQPLYAASALDGSHHFPWVIAWLSGDFLSCSSLVDDQFRSVLFVPVFRLGISLQMHATGLVQHVSPGSVLHLFWNEAAPSSVITIFLDGGHQLEDKSLQPMLALSNFSLNRASLSVVYLDPDGPLLHCTPTAQTGHDIHLVVERMNLLLPPLRKGIEHQPDIHLGPCRQLISEVREEVFLLQPKLPRSPLLICRVVAVQNPVYTMINLCVSFIYGLQLQLGSDTISNMEGFLEYVYHKCFIFQSSAGLKFDVDFRGYLTTVLVDNNTLSCSVLCLSSAYASHGNNSTIQSDSALLQWEIAWFSWMGTLHPELLWCILGQENGGKDGAHMTWNVGGLASTVLNTQCSVSAYHDALAINAPVVSSRRSPVHLRTSFFLVVLLPWDPSDFVTVTSNVWVLERLHSKIVKCLLVYLTVQQTVSIAKAGTIASLRFFCDKCSSLQATQKRMKIKTPTNILVFHLKQFKYIEQIGHYKKLSYHVVLPLELKLINIVDRSDLEYSLFAVPVHVAVLKVSFCKASISSCFEGYSSPCGFEPLQWKIAWTPSWESFAVSRGASDNISFYSTNACSSHAWAKDFHCRSLVACPSGTFLAEVTAAMHIIPYQFPLLVKTSGFGVRLARGRAKIHRERIITGQPRRSYGCLVLANTSPRIMVECFAIGRTSLFGEQSFKEGGVSCLWPSSSIKPAPTTGITPSSTKSVPTTTTPSTMLESSSSSKSTSTMATSVKATTTNLTVPWDPGRNYSASAWGQAEFEGGRNVMGTTISGTSGEAQGRPGRPKRDTKPNPLNTEALIVVQELKI